MKRALTVAVLLVLAGMLTVRLALRPHLPAAERGRRLAERTGCFTCHGAGGLHGASNPGRTDGTVPNWSGDLMMFAEGPAEVREWIRDGVTRKRAASETWRSQRRKGALKMPAFKDRFDERRIDDLVAFVMAVSPDDTPDDSLAAAGQARVRALGCDGCHGAGGRLAPPNPGSLKGYVPSWDGQDFAELVKNRAEFDAWVSDGVSDRFARNRFARFFLDRAVLHMPAFQKHLEPGDLDALWAYVTWLRTRPGTPASP